MLSKHLTEKGISTLKTREPGGTPIGEKIRNIFNHPPQEEKWTPLGELLMISALRVQHLVNLISPNIEKGVWVLCDRFFDSSTVYQGHLGEVSIDLVRFLNKTVTNDRLPDVTFLLDADFETCQNRLKLRSNKKTRFDSLERKKHEIIRESFLKIAEENKDRIYLLDASQNLESLKNEVLKTIQTKFNLKI